MPEDTYFRPAGARSFRPAVAGLSGQRWRVPMSHAKLFGYAKIFLGKFVICLNHKTFNDLQQLIPDPLNPWTLRANQMTDYFLSLKDYLKG
jgi:hypothetical protein